MAVVQETRFEYKGYPCVVLFQSGGHRCGYVGIQNGCAVGIENIRCHGGITYSKNHLALQEDKDMFWIGFDTAHCFDARDFESAKKHFAEDKEVMKSIVFLEMMDMRFPTGGEIRTLDYCIEECKSIVDQLCGGKDAGPIQHE